MNQQVALTDSSQAHYIYLAKDIPPHDHRVILATRTLATKLKCFT